MTSFRVVVQDHLNSFRTILIGFAVLILLGAFLLNLPVASADRQSVPFLNALFTSASAACVTGLVVYDTATQWSLFGRTVILILIQIGGLGVVTAFVATMLLTGKRIGLMQRIAMQDSVSAPQVGGIIRFTSFFLKGTLIIETLGALLLLPLFAQEFGLLQGLGYAVFHSVSAFCNAGFDLMGVQSPYSSLTAYAGSAWVNIVICGLIIVGGLGFMSWNDLLKNQFHFRSLRLQTKMILVTTAILITVPFLVFFFFGFADMPLKERILMSFFQSVTPRTAGFNTADYSKMSDGLLLMTVILMMIGGAPGSTAGGMKVTTIAVVALATHTYVRGRENTNVFKRRLESQAIHNAFALFMLYLALLLSATFILDLLEETPLMPVMFECASALGTVGLSTGITPYLSAVSKIILICLMFVGRVGGLTLTYAMVSIGSKGTAKYPAEKLTVG